MHPATQDPQSQPAGMTAGAGRRATTPAAAAKAAMLTMRALSLIFDIDTSPFPVPGALFRGAMCPAGPIRHRVIGHYDLIE
jgi:hypothetical protein